MTIVFYPMKGPLTFIYKKTFIYQKQQNMNNLLK